MTTTATRRLGSMQDAAKEHGVHYGRVRKWATEPDFPAALDRTHRPHTYDLDEVAAWREQRQT